MNDPGFPTMSLVQRNLLTIKGYTPYCGSPNCDSGWPRTKFDGEQFVCGRGCGWKSSFYPEFIERYKAAQLQLASKET